MKMNKIEYYKAYPDKFYKEVLNIDLLPYQIKLLKIMLKINKIYKKGNLMKKEINIGINKYNN